MSWKVYNAYEWRGGSLEALVARLRWFRERTWNTAVSKLLIDLPREKFRMLSYGEAVRDVIRSQRHEDVHPDFGIVENVEASAVIYLHRRRVFVQFFGVDERIIALKRSGLFDYHWQNSSGCPEDVLQAAWKERERTWRAIFEKETTPAKAGLVVPFIQDSDGWRIAHSVYASIHGHPPWPQGDEAKGCKVCEWRRNEKPAADVKSAGNKNG